MSTTSKAIQLSLDELVELALAYADQFTSADAASS